MADNLNASQIGLVGDVVQGASNLGGSIVNAIFQKKENQRNRAFAQQQAQQSRQWQIEQWNMENAYNSPVAQMHRYIDSGLNPNLIYGQLGNGLNSAPSVPQGEAVQGVAPHINADFGLGGTLQGELIDAQIADLRSQVNRRDKLTDKEYEKLGSEIGLNQEQSKYLIARTAETYEAMRNIAKQWILMDKDERLKNYEIQVKRKTWVDSVNRIKDEAKITHAEANYASRYFLSRVLNIEADTDLKKSAKELNDKEVEYWNRTMDDLVSIVKSSKTQQECAAALAEFLTPKNTQAWKFWLEQGLGYLLQASQVFSNVASPVKIGSGTTKVVGFLGN